MITEQFKKNLLVLLDPAGNHAETSWCFMPHGSEAATAQPRDGRHQIFCFPRQALFPYLLQVAQGWLIARSDRRYRMRRLLLLNDGLLCSLFDCGNYLGYRAFSRTHLPRPQGVRSRLLRLATPFWRAELRMVVLENRTSAVSPPHHEPPVSGDFLFYSNEAGKLMLTDNATLFTGTGRVFKTTTTPGYARCLRHEQAIISSITPLLPDKKLLQGPQEHLELPTRTFYSEPYLQGENLRERLRVLGEQRDQAAACQLLDLLDGWFSDYTRAFKGVAQQFSLLYAPMLLTFAERDAAEHDCPLLLRRAGSLCRQLDQDYGGTTAIIAHNDLWPGNFLLHGQHLIAIDWERATAHAPPFFDYFWMIISAALEFLVGENRCQDYSLCFRQLLNDTNLISRHARQLLRGFLLRLGISPKQFSTFMLLFLMEWSIQGYRSLGRITAMDRLAREELAAFSRDMAAA